MEWIETSEQLPEDNLYKDIIDSRGRHIAYYRKRDDVWIDREGFHIKKVSHWAEN